MQKFIRWVQSWLTEDIWTWGTMQKFREGGRVKKEGKNNQITKIKSTKQNISQMSTLYFIKCFSKLRDE